MADKNTAAIGFEEDILPKNFARPELDKRRLGDVVDLFTNIQMIEHGRWLR